MTLATQTREMRVPLIRRRVPRICDRNSKSTHELNQTKSN